MSNDNNTTGEHSGASLCSRYLEWLEAAAERETIKARAAENDGEFIASAFSDGVAVGLRLAGTEFVDGEIYSTND